jgi:hypothetical protein
VDLFEDVFIFIWFNIFSLVCQYFKHMRQCKSGIDWHAFVVIMVDIFRFQLQLFYGCRFYQFSLNLLTFHWKSFKGHLLTYYRYMWTLKLNFIFCFLLIITDYPRVWGITSLSSYSTFRNQFPFGLQGDLYLSWPQQNVKF